MSRQMCFTLLKYLLFGEKLNVNETVADICVCEPSGLLTLVRYHRLANIHRRKSRV